MGNCGLFHIYLIGNQRGVYEIGEKVQAIVRKSSKTLPTYQMGTLERQSGVFVIIGAISCVTSVFFMESLL